MSWNGNKRHRDSEDRRDALHRTVDVIGVWLALPLSVPLMMILAPCVFLALGRPVLFAQTRSGRLGRTFTLVKFRTMTNERNTAGELLPDKWRMTKFGRLVRRSRLDELPELWNIFKGDMSFIGPRPLLPETVTQMGDEGQLRSSVRPGLTGWAQISGNSSLHNDDKLALDLWYIENRSLSLDALICLKTVGVMMFGETVSTQRLLLAQGERKLAQPPERGT